MRTSSLLAPLAVIVAVGALACGSSDDDGETDAGVEQIDAMVVACTAPDSDGDGVCDAEDVCPEFDDAADDDGDAVPDGCDVCAGFGDGNDADSDSVPDGCDACAASDDALDADVDGVPDGCDACAGSNDAMDTDNDGVADGCDLCAGFDDSIDTNGNDVPDACEGSCDTSTEVELSGDCYYLDGSGGVCDQGYALAAQSVLATIAPQFVGKTYKHQSSSNCCITHSDQAAEGQDWGMEDDCNEPGTFLQGPLLGGASCNDANNMEPAQLTLCRSQ